MIETFDTVAQLTERAAGLFAQTAQQAVKERGQFVVALSGGHSPQPIYRLLSQPDYKGRVPWSATYVFWSDERYVPSDDERSNAGVAGALLLDQVDIPDNQIFPVYSMDLSTREAADAYEHLVVETFKPGSPQFDLIFLGCGADGHTASLFPGSPLVHEKEKLVAAVGSGPDHLPRVTMTPRLLNKAHRVVVIAYGEEKASIVQRVLEGPSLPQELPVQAISPTNGELHWLLDRSASARLGSRGRR